MSCLTTSATRRSRSVPAAVLIASAAASSHELLLVPIISVTLYTLIRSPLTACGPLRGYCRQLATEPTLSGRRCRKVTAHANFEGGPPNRYRLPPCGCPSTLIERHLSRAPQAAKSG